MNRANHIKECGDQFYAMRHLRRGEGAETNYSGVLSYGAREAKLDYGWGSGMPWRRLSTDRMASLSLTNRVPRNEPVARS
jgi:hypothetical protein